MYFFYVIFPDYSIIFARFVGRGKPQAGFADEKFHERQYFYNYIQMKITIIGSGNIGSALVSGLLRSEGVNVEDIILTDVNEMALASFAQKGVTVLTNNVWAVEHADIIILCVKPYLAGTVIEEILPSLRNQLLVSVAAGITLDRLSLYAGKRPLFRVIPNTAMAVCRSMTCIAAAGANDEQSERITGLFNLVGETMIIDESLMNAATVIASCGTAFALRYLRAGMAAGIEIGFKPDIAGKMIAQTMLGAAVLMKESDEHPEKEIDKVATPKGITIKGLNEMEHAGFSSAVMQGILAAYDVFNI
jgi:pyrroline-5-carboxylate reductase